MSGKNSKGVPGPAMNRVSPAQRVKQERLMVRYAVQPLGGGTYGLYDRAQQKFIHTYSGRGAEQKANRKWRSLVGVS